MEEERLSRQWALAAPPDRQREEIDPSMSVADALELLRRDSRHSLPVIHPDSGALLGVLSSPLSPAPPPVPPRFGGMATPLGVYLTDGVHSGGAGFLGLFLTGVVLGSLSLVVQACVQAGARLLTPTLTLPVAGALPWLQSWMGQIAPELASTVLVLALLFVCLRCLPMSGTHAAEHQVVHCIERSAPLVPSCVRAMPRVHPRCGTNLAVGFVLFQLTFVAVWSAAVADRMAPADAASIAGVAGAIVSLFFWRRLGGWVQYWLATRPATDRQISSAIRAAEELLERRRQAETRLTGGRPRFFVGRRLWRMGLGQVLLGYAAVLTLLELITHFWPGLGNVLGV